MEALCDAGKEDDFPDAKPSAQEQEHWFYKFFATDWRRSTKSNQQRMHEPFQLEVLGRQITLQQGLVKNEATLGLTVWDGCIVLSKFLENETLFPKGHFAGKRVVELGAGTGLVSIVLSLLGARVTATDMDKEAVMAILHKNLAANQITGVEVKPHNWGSDPSPLQPPFDYVLAADVIFREELVPSLVKSIEALSGPETRVYMCAENHSQKALDLFFELAKQRFVVTTVAAEDLHPLYQDDRIVLALLRLKPSPINSRLLALPMEPEPDNRKAELLVTPMLKSGAPPATGRLIPPEVQDLFDTVHDVRLPDTIYRRSSEFIKSWWEAFPIGAEVPTVAVVGGYDERPVAVYFCWIQAGAACLFEEQETVIDLYTKEEPRHKLPAYHFPRQ